jgi:hypothetical protein
MTRVNINEDTEDTLFRIFDHSQGIERRTFRILARGFFNAAAIDEMRRQAQGMLDEIKALAQAAEEE